MGFCVSGATYPGGNCSGRERSLQTSTLSQQELESRLWDAANSLRGPVNPADFKAYVFPLFLFKWISDTWDMEHVEVFPQPANFSIERTHTSVRTTECIPLRPKRLMEEVARVMKARREGVRGSPQRDYWGHAQ